MNFFRKPLFTAPCKLLSSGDKYGRKCIHDTSRKALSVHFLNEKVSDNLHSLSHCAGKKLYAERCPDRFFICGIRSSTSQHKFDIIDGLGQAILILISTILKREILSPTSANTWQLYQRAISTNISKSQFKLC